MLNGILILDKPRDFTSHDAVAKLRGMLRQKKIGHAGTLDPMATGVLVVLLGNATRASDHASGQDKTYRARLRLGTVTDTQDITGTVLAQNPGNVPEEALRAALEALSGESQQLPPMYSAVQVGGKRLYDLARRGQEVARDSRAIHTELTLLPREAGLPETDWDLSARCSKGTYVRTLCHDLGAALGCGGCMAELRRERSGRFTLEDALTFDQVRECLENGTLSSHIFPTDTVFSDLPAVFLNEAGDVRASHGAFFTEQHLARGVLPAEGERCRVYTSEGRFCQVGEGGRLDMGANALFCKINFPTLP